MHKNNGGKNLKKSLDLYPNIKNLQKQVKHKEKEYKN